MASQLPPPKRLLVTARQLSEQQPGLTLGAVRADLRNRGVNGLAKAGALVYRGRRILIDPDQYLAWLESPKPLTATTLRR